MWLILVVYTEQLSCDEYLMALFLVGFNGCSSPIIDARCPRRVCICMIAETEYLFGSLRLSGCLREVVIYVKSVVT